MPDRFVVSGVGRYDGEYDFDVEAEPFTTREWEWIKKLAGYMPRTVGDGIDGGDAPLMVTLCVIAMARNGKVSKDQVPGVVEFLKDQPFDGARIQLVGDAEAAASPPA